MNKFCHFWQKAVAFSVFNSSNRARNKSYIDIFLFVLNLTLENGKLHFCLASRFLESRFEVIGISFLQNQFPPFAK